MCRDSARSSRASSGSTWRIRTVALGELLRRRADAHDFEGYLARLEAPDGSAELRSLAPDLTVGETYFFRNFAQTQAFEEVALPTCIQARAAQRTLRILSAGCASGEEAYSLAIPVQRAPATASREGGPIQLRHRRQPAAIEKATAARYSAWSLRETPADVRDRYFRPTARLRRSMTACGRRSRSRSETSSRTTRRSGEPGAFDVVVLPQRAHVLHPRGRCAPSSRASRSALAGGFLFLGHAETLRGVRRHFTSATRTRRSTTSDATIATRPRGQRRRDSTRPRGTTTATSSWVGGDPAGLETRRAARAGPRERPLGGLRRRRRVDRARADRDLRPCRGAACGTNASPTRWRCSRRCPPLATDPDAQLLRAVLAHERRQAGRGRGGVPANPRRATSFTRAPTTSWRSAASTRAIAPAPSSTTRSRRTSTRASRCRTCTSGSRHGARATRSVPARSSVAPLALLEREDASRILLFGGGFSREALIELCRRELRACGGGS